MKAVALRHLGERAGPGIAATDRDHARERLFHRCQIDRRIKGEHARIVDLIPGGWLAADEDSRRAAALRTAYREYLTERLKAPRAFIDEALRVR